MIEDPVLVDDWHPVATCVQLVRGRPLGVRIPALEGRPPPRARVRTYRALERYGLIWVSLGAPAHQPPPFPEWHQDGFRKLPCGPYPVAASGPRIVENFLDVAHFAFVHEGILGTPERPEIADHEAMIGEDGVLATGVRVYQPDPYGTGQGDWVSCARSRRTCSRNRRGRGSRSCSPSRPTSRPAARLGCGWQ